MRRIAGIAALCAAVLLGPAGPAGANTVEDGFRALARGDRTAAVDIWRTAVRRAETEAGPTLRNLLYDGMGRPGDAAEAARLYRIAADQGNRHAQFSLAVMYLAGRGVPQDYAEAARYFHLAAERGHEQARLSLGYMYALGTGVARDPVTAYAWASRSMQGDRPAWQRYRRASELRGRLSEVMTPAQIVEAERRAGQWPAR